MKIDVWFFGSFRNLTAVRQQTIQMPDGQTIEGLIALLAREYGAAFSDLTSRLDECFLMVNGNYCTLPVGKDRSLKEGDQVAFIPIITGG